MKHCVIDSKFAPSAALQQTVIFSAGQVTARLLRIGKFLSERYRVPMITTTTNPPTIFNNLSGIDFKSDLETAFILVVQQGNDNNLKVCISSDPIRSMDNTAPQETLVQIDINALTSWDAAQKISAALTEHKVLSLPFEFWFRKQYEGAVENQTLKNFIRPGDRTTPGGKGVSVGTKAWMRILEEHSSDGYPHRLASLSPMFKAVTVTGAVAQPIQDFLQAEWEACTPRMENPNDACQHLEGIYNRSFKEKEIVTLFTTQYD